MTISDLVTTLKSIEPYIDHVILREKTKTTEELITLCAQLSLIGFNIDKVIMHRHPHIAIQAGISQVHLPGSGSSLTDIKIQFPSLSVGQSVHSIDEAKSAEKAGAHYLLYGHIFESTCKPGLQPRGICALKEITAAVSIPVIAIGGIQPTHLKILQQTNSAGFAVMSSIFKSAHPESIAQLYAEKVKEKRGSPNEKIHLFEWERT